MRVVTIIVLISISVAGMCWRCQMYDDCRKTHSKFYCMEVPR